MSTARTRRTIGLAAAALGLLGVLGATAAETPAPADARQRIVLVPAARDRILAEMRAMLESLGGVVQGLAAGDLAAAEKAARAAGMAAAADVQPEIKGQLPPGFRELGMQTHLAFDRLADGLRAGASRDGALRSVADVTARCVACHAAWRLDEAR